MILIVGLGNPGKKYTRTQHNVGFRIIDYFRKANNFPTWRNNRSFFSKISLGKIGNKKIILAKPQTFMNNSGQAVSKIIKKFKIKTKDIIVCQDDLDINFGKIKISVNKSSAGHKGIESIIQSIGTKNFTRIRLGTKTEKETEDKKDIVLTDFSSEEEKKIPELLSSSNNMILKILES